MRLARTDLGGREHGRLGDGLDDEPVQQRVQPPGLDRGVPVDRPFERLRDVLRVDLSGHLLVSGAPGSGGSTLLATLVIALTLTHSPREAQVHCLDLDHSLGALAGLPHVGAVAGDAATAGATIAKVTALLDHREHLFAEHGVDGMPGYRSRRAEFPDERYGDAFLLVDGLVDDAYEADLARLAADGPANGVHLVVTAGRAPEPPAFLQSGTGLELRLDDPATPGRGMIGESAYLTALPRVDGVESIHELGSAVVALVTEVAEHWANAPARPAYARSRPS